MYPETTLNLCFNLIVLKFFSSVMRKDKKISKKQPVYKTSRFGKC